MEPNSDNFSSSMNNTNMESHHEQDRYILEMRPCDQPQLKNKEMRSSLFNKRLPLARQKSMNFRQNVRKKRQELAEKQVQPFCCSKAVVKYPWLVIGVTFIIFLICLTLILSLGLFKYSNVQGFAFYVSSDPKVQSWYASIRAEEQTRDSLFPNADQPNGAVYSQWQTYISYESDDNLLTASNLQTIVSFENALLANTQFRKFCPAQISPPSDCDLAQQGLISFLFTGVDLTNQAAIDATIAGATAANPNVLKLLDSTYSDTQTAPNMRATLEFAGPVEGYSSIEDRPVEQRLVFVEMLHELDILAQEMSTDSVKVNLVNKHYTNWTVLALSEKDQIWIIGSFCLVLCYLIIHTKSTFLAVFGMIETVMGFPIAFILFKGVLQISFFGTMHFNLVFMILGVAADDFFIFSDSWRQAGKMQALIQGDINRRMAITYRRASKSMFVTSVTSAAAFAVAAFTSDLMPIKSLGLMGSALLIVNYFMVCSVFPSLIILRYRFINSTVYRRICKCKRCGRKVKLLERAVSPNHKANNSIDSFVIGNPQCGEDDGTELPSPSREAPTSPVRSFTSNLTRSHTLRSSVLTPEEQEYANQGCIERFFYFKFSKCVRIARIPILVAFVCWVVVATYLAFQIAPLGEQEVWLPKDHRMYKAIENLSNNFPQGRGDQIMHITLYWGVKDLDRSEVSMWDPDSLGQVNFDPEFSMSNPEAQQLFYDWCIDLTSKEYLLTTVSNEEKVFCFMSGFRGFLLAQGKAFPVAESDFESELQQFAFHSSSLEYRKAGVFGFNEAGRLIQAQVELTSYIDANSKNIDEVEKYWEDICESYNLAASLKSTTSGLANCKYDGGLIASWKVSQRKLVENSLMGVVVVLGVSLFILLTSTCNVVISVYALASIGGIIVSNLAALKFIGWELGVTEAMTLVVFIGFAIDYVVHLANHYVGALSPSRGKRMSEAYADIGVSILGGAITTIASGFLLIFARFLLFIKFSVLIILTIVFSVLFSLFFFGALAHLIGPQGNKGNLLVMLGPCVNRCRKQKKSESTVKIVQRVSVPTTTLSEVNSSAARVSSVQGLI